MNKTFFSTSILLLFITTLSFGQTSEMSLNLLFEENTYDYDDAVIVGDYLIGVDDSFDDYYLMVLDISDISNPEIISVDTILRELRPKHLLVNNNHLFIMGEGSTTHDYHFEVFDITNPTDPVSIRAYERFIFQGNDLRPEAFHGIRGNDLIIKNGVFAIATLDITDVSNITVRNNTGLVLGVGKMEFDNNDGAWITYNDHFRHIIFNADGSITPSDVITDVTGALYDIEIMADNKTALTYNWTGGPQYMGVYDLSNPNAIAEIALFDYQDSIGAGSSANVLLDEQRNIVFLQAPVASGFIMVDISDLNSSQVIRKYEGKDFIRRYDDIVLTQGFAGRLLFYQLNGREDQLWPTTNFTVDKDSIGSGESVQFTDLSGNNPTSWQWTFEGGTPGSSTEQNPQVTYNQPGNLSVTLIATNANGSVTETRSSFIEVSSNLIPEFEADFTEIALADSVSFTDLSIGGANSWSWIFEGGTPGSSTEQNPIVKYLTAGIYNVTLTISDNLGSSDPLIKQDYIKVKAINADFTFEKDLLVAGDSVLFTDVSTGASPVSWDWQISGPSTSSSDEQNPVITFSTPGIYTVSLTIFDGNESDTETKVELIEVLAELIANFDVTDTLIAVGESITYLDQSGNSAEVYEWNFEGGDPSTSINKNQTVIYTNAGTFDATLMVSNAIQKDTLIKENHITVKEVIAGFGADKTDILIGEEISFTDSTRGNPIAWEWIFEGGEPSTSSTQNPTVTYPVEGEYDVTLISSGISETDTIKVVNMVKVKAMIAEFSSDISVVAAGDTVSFSDNSLGATPTNRVWTFEGGIPETSTETNPKVIWPNTGLFDVTLTISDSTSEDTKTLEEYIKVEKTPAPSGLNAIAVSSSRINLSWQDNSLIEEQYNIWRSDGDDTNFVLIGEKEANSTSFEDTGLNSLSLYFYKVNAAFSQEESDFSNVVSTTTLDVDPADLILENELVSATFLSAGSEISFSGEIINVGIESADSSFVRFYFSKNNLLEVSDTIAGQVKIGILDSAGVESFNYAVIISNTIEIDTLFVFFKLDAENEVDESDEENNVIVVMLTPPDLIIEDEVVSLNSFGTGGEVSFTGNVVNVGSRSARASNVKLFFSTEPSFGESVTEMGNIQIAELDPMQRESFSHTTTLSQDFEGDSLYVYFVVDDIEGITESNEDNNINRLSLKIDVLTAIESIESSQINIYPNPASNWINISHEYQKPIENVKIISLKGEIVYDNIGGLIDVSKLKTGVYVINIETGNKVVKRNLIIE